MRSAAMPTTSRPRRTSLPEPRPTNDVGVPDVCHWRAFRRRSRNDSSLSLGDSRRRMTLWLVPFARDGRPSSRRSSTERVAQSRLDGEKHATKATDGYTRSPTRGPHRSVVPSTIVPEPHSTRTRRSRSATTSAADAKVSRVAAASISCTAALRTRSSPGSSCVVPVRNTVRRLDDVDRDGTRLWRHVRRWLVTRRTRAEAFRPLPVDSRRRRWVRAGVRRMSTASAEASTGWSAVVTSDPAIATSDRPAPML